MKNVYGTKLGEVHAALQHLRDEIALNLGQGDAEIRNRYADVLEVLHKLEVALNDGVCPLPCDKWIGWESCKATRKR